MSKLEPWKVVNTTSISITRNGKLSNIQKQNFPYCHAVVILRHTCIYDIAFYGMIMLLHRVKTYLNGCGYVRVPQFTGLQTSKDLDQLPLGQHLWPHGVRVLGQLPEGDEQLVTVTVLLHLRRDKG